MISFEQLERQKRDMTDRISAWPESLLTFTPSTESWSALGILDHLARTESEILATARRGLDAPHPIGLRDRLGVRFLYNVFQLERRVKVPAAAKAVLPDGHADLPAVLERWDDTRSALAACIAEVGHKPPKGGVFRHPVGGWMSFSDVLDFFSVHLVHHEHQLKRIEHAFDQIRQPNNAI